MRLAELNLASAWVQVEMIANGRDVQLTQAQARLLSAERRRFRRDRQAVREARDRLATVSLEEI
jgi:hypothetical protein